jgi:hypothetical protein
LEDENEDEEAELKPNPAKIDTSISAEQAVTEVNLPRGWRPRVAP